VPLRHTASVPLFTKVPFNVRLVLTVVENMQEPATVKAAVAVSLPQMWVPVIVTAWPTAIVTVSPSTGTTPPTQVLPTLDRPDCADVIAAIYAPSYTVTVLTMSPVAGSVLAVVYMVGAVSGMAG